MREHPSAGGSFLWDAAWYSYRHGNFGESLVANIRRALGLPKKVLLTRPDWETCWEDLESEGLQESPMWAICGMPPKVAAEWLTECRKNGWEQWVALEWATLNQKNRLFLSAGVTPDEYPTIRPHLTKAGRRPPCDESRSTEVVVALSKTWGVYDIPLSVAWRWRRHGFVDPVRVAPWRNSGFSPSEAAQYDIMGLTAQDAEALQTVAAAYTTDDSCSEDTTLGKSVAELFDFEADSLDSFEGFWGGSGEDPDPQPST